MKTLITALTFTLSAAFSFAQDNSAKIIEAFGQTEYDQMSTSNPGMIELLDKYASYGMELQDMDAKFANSPLLTEIKLRTKTAATVSVSEFITAFNSSDFNALQYDFFPGNEVQIFRLSGMNKILVINNQRTILSK